MWIGYPARLTCLLPPGHRSVTSTRGRRGSQPARCRPPASTVHRRGVTGL
jgi:hypothetical protein